ncbi:MAG: ribosome maturation factor [Candidatus Omnitrophica bacterium]|nr:ribosome maturation factor [Candidatus Omnitrophota bacterium]
MGRIEELKVDVLKYAQPICDALGLDIVELGIHPYNETLNVQLFVDRPLGGIEIDECTKVNHRLDVVLYEELKLGNNYTLEVSSPGLDRPLKTFPDFRRVIGRDIHLFLRERVQEKMELEGELKGVREAEVIIETKKGECIIPIALIERGKQVIS